MIPIPPPKGINRVPGASQRPTPEQCGRPTVCAEVRRSPQEADSQYIEEGSLSKRMFSEVTFPNSFLSFPAS